MAEQRLIDANAALEKVCENCCCDFEECQRDGFCEDYMNIKQLPTVDAEEVVHGRWVYEEEPDKDGNVQARCSVCFAGDLHSTAMMNKVPHCWKCGAKMDGENEDG